MSEKKTAVIGSGPAGLTAAIYLSRANLNPTVFAGSVFGGQLMITTEVENFPGFPEGIYGPELMEKMIAQAKKFGAEMVYKDVTKVDFSSKPFTIWVGDESFQFDGVVVATGSSAKTLGLSSELQLTGRGVSYCATCDGAFFRNREIAVVGGGDSAMEEANFLTKFASKVYLLHRRDSFKASKIMQQKALTNPKIVPVYNTEVSEILGEEKVTGIKTRNTVDGKEEVLPVEGLFIAIGHNPNIKVFEKVLDHDEIGYLTVGHGTSTNIPGIFSAGDVDDHKYMQAITAAGEGCKAAIDLERFLEGITL